MGLEVGLGDGEGLGVTDMLGEGVPEPGSCPGAALEKALSPRLRSLVVLVER